MKTPVKDIPGYKINSNPRLKKAGIYGYMYGWALVTLHLNTRNTYRWHPKTTSQCLQRTTTSRK